LWAEWPKWDDDYTFRTPNLTFTCSWHLPDWANFECGRIPIHKTRGMIDRYGELLSGRDVRCLAEIGYLYGGMVLFFADMLPNAKIVGIDLKQPKAEVVEVVSRLGLRDRARFHDGTAQDDKIAVRRILDEEFGDQPLDLITEDASHFYPQSKATFEACFGYLRPGAPYVLEDWGWAHWNSPEWQDNAPLRYATKLPLSQLIFELSMLLASQPQILSRLDIRDGAFAIATRGDGLAPREPIDLDRCCLTAGRRFLGFHAPQHLLQELEAMQQSAASWEKKYKRVIDSRSWRLLSRVQRVVAALRLSSPTKRGRRR
jgi:hypothetical protein